MEEGPEALDYWAGKIKEAEALALGYAERLGKLKAKKASKDTQVEKMRERMRRLLARLPEWQGSNPLNGLWPRGSPPPRPTGCAWLRF